MGDPQRPRARPQLGSVPGLSHPLCEGVGPEEEVGEVGALQVVGVAPGANEPDPCVGRKFLVNDVVIRVVVEPPGEELLPWLSPQHHLERIQLGEPRDDHQGVRRRGAEEEASEEAAGTGSPFGCRSRCGGRDRDR